MTNIVRKRTANFLSGFLVWSIRIDLHCVCCSVSFAYTLLFDYSQKQWKFCSFFSYALCGTKKFSFHDIKFYFERFLFGVFEKIKFGNFRFFGNEWNYLLNFLIIIKKFSIYLVKFFHLFNIESKMLFFLIIEKFHNKFFLANVSHLNSFRTPMAFI